MDYFYFDIRTKEAKSLLFNVAASQGLLRASFQADYPSSCRSYRALKALRPGEKRALRRAQHKIKLAFKDYGLLTQSIWPHVLDRYRKAQYKRRHPDCRFVPSDHKCADTGTCAWCWPSPDSAMDDTDSATDEELYPDPVAIDECPCGGPHYKKAPVIIL